MPPSPTANPLLWNLPRQVHFAKNTPIGKLFSTTGQEVLVSLLACVFVLRRMFGKRVFRLLICRQAVWIFGLVVFGLIIVTRKYDDKQAFVWEMSYGLRPLPPAPEL